jgi:hypothetical protein
MTQKADSLKICQTVAANCCHVQALCHPGLLGPQLLHEIGRADDDKARLAVRG